MRMPAGPASAVRLLTRGTGLDESRSGRAASRRVVCLLAITRQGSMNVTYTPAMPSAPGYFHAHCGVAAGLGGAGPRSEQGQVHLPQARQLRLCRTVSPANAAGGPASVPAEDVEGLRARGPRAEQLTG